MVNTGQMLLVLGGFVLLATLAISVNSTVLSSDQVAVEAQTASAALSLGEGELDKLVALGFDGLVIGSSLDTLVTNYETFTCSTKVEYVSLTNPDSVSVAATVCKRVTVKLFSPYMSGQLALSSVVGQY